MCQCRNIFQRIYWLLDPYLKPANQNTALHPRQPLVLYFILLARVRLSSIGVRSTGRRRSSRSSRNAGNRRRARSESSRGAARLNKIGSEQLQQGARAVADRGVHALRQFR